MIVPGLTSTQSLPDPRTEQIISEPCSSADAWLSRVSIGVAFCWIAYLAYLLTARVTPIEIGLFGPPHLTSSVALAVALSAILGQRANNAMQLGWWTLLGSTALIVALECIQLPLSYRAFEFTDIAEGISGAAIVAMAAALLCSLIGKRAYCWLAIVTAAVVLAVSPLMWSFKTRQADTVCVAAPLETVNWQSQLIHNFRSGEDGVSTSIGEFCLFEPLVDDDTDPQVAPVPATVKNASMLFNGAVLASPALVGLRAAIAETGSLTLGVRFKPVALEPGRPPRQLVALQTVDAQPFIVARILQNGPNASARIGFQRWQGSSTALPNRLQNAYQEIVITFDGVTQTTYLNGVALGMEISKLDPLRKQGSELMLSIGRRTDQRWLPFRGDIQAVYLGSNSIGPKAVKTLFKALHGDP